MSTQNSENVLLRAVFHYAATNDWITKAQVPVIELKIPHAKKGRDAHRRPGLNGEEVMRLLNLAQERYETAPDDRVKHQRFLLYTFVGMMAYGGMRPFECMKLRWKDLGSTGGAPGSSHEKIFVSGKGKSRWLIAIKPFLGITYFISMYTAMALKDKGYKIKTNEEFENRLVFSELDGTPIKSLSRGFTALLKEAGLHIDPETGKQRDSYCLRHYYATERLIAGVSVYTLAENMGTSVSMIERHYGHLKPEMAAEELTKPGKK